MTKRLMHDGLLKLEPGVKVPFCSWFTSHFTTRASPSSHFFIPCACFGTLDERKGLQDSIWLRRKD